jgi:hypothetical protein
MDMLDLDKLNKEAQVFERITDGTVDDTAYNAVTQSINEGVINDTREEIEGILSKGHDVNDRLDFTDLEKSVNGAFGITEAADPKLDKVGEEDADVNNDGEVDEQDEYIKNKRETIESEIKKEDKMENINEASAANPSGGVDSAEKFLKADAVKQTDFVTAKTGSKESKELDEANTNTEHSVTEHSSDDSVEKQADNSMKEMQKGAEDNKEFVEVAKTQVDAEAKSVLKENADKFESFVSSLKNEENAKYIDGILEAYGLSIKSLI